MQPIKYLPWIFFSAFCAVLLGFFVLSWPLTSALPWLITLPLLLFTSSLWRSASITVIRRLQLVVFLVALLSSAAYTFSVFGLNRCWPVFVICGFAAAQLCFSDIALSGRIHSGWYRRLITAFPLLSGIALAMIFLAGWSVFPAALILVLSLLSAVYALFSAKRNIK